MTSSSSNISQQTPKAPLSFSNILSIGNANVSTLRQEPILISMLNSPMSNFGQEIQIPVDNMSNPDTNQLEHNLSRNFNLRRALSDVPSFSVDKNDTYFYNNSHDDGLDLSKFLDPSDVEFLCTHFELDESNPSSSTSQFRVNEIVNTASSGVLASSELNMPMTLEPSADASSFVNEDIGASTSIIKDCHKRSRLLVDPKTFDAFPVRIRPIRKKLPADQLAHLKEVDPKRALRIISNRESAARSRVQRLNNLASLKEKMETLKQKASSISEEWVRLQSKECNLKEEKIQLKHQLEMVKQQVRTKDDINISLREEINNLKQAIGQVMANGATIMTVQTLTNQDSKVLKQ